MDNKKENTNIKCSVSSCKFHSDAKNCCSLNSIQVGSKQPAPNSCEGTECSSFCAQQMK